MDGYADITPSTNLNDAIHRIEQHGGVAGIVGLTVIARQFTLLKKPLRASKRAHELLEVSGQAAADRLLEITERMAELKNLSETQQGKK